MIQLKLQEPSPEPSKASPSQINFPQRPTFSEEPELEIRQAEQLNPLTVHCHPLNHTTVPTLSPSVSIAGFTCDIYLAGAHWIWKHNEGLNALKRL